MTDPTLLQVIPDGADWMRYVYDNGRVWYSSRRAEWGCWDYPVAYGTDRQTVTREA